MTLLFYLLAVVIFGGVSYRLRWLTAGGSITASAFGFCLLWLGGWPWVLPLLIFFGSSSALSKIRGKGVKSREKDKKRDDIRNVTQVLANGGMAWLLLLLYALTNELYWYAGFIGSLAAATADTWATEIGRLAGGKPRHILTGGLLDKGLSGGITWQGTTGSMMGAVVIGLSCVPFYDNSMMYCLILGLVAGMVGSLLDSVLGGTVQAKYLNEETGAITEKKKSGDSLRKISGINRVNNDLVNVCCTFSGGVVGILLGYLFH